MATEQGHLLVVDDEEGIRHLFQATLEGEGFSCHTASNGSEALELLADWNFDLALVDMNMPEITGIKLFHYLASNHPNVGVIFVTAMNGTGIAVDRTKSGPYDYLVKPVTMARLFQAVNDALALRRHNLATNEQQGRLAETLNARSSALRNKERGLGAASGMIQTKLAQEPSDEGYGPLLVP